MSEKTALIYALILSSSCRSILLFLCLSSPFFVPIRRTHGACRCRIGGEKMKMKKQEWTDDGRSGNIMLLLI